QPNLADQDVLQLDGVLALDGHPVRLAVGLDRPERHPPQAELVRLGRLLLAVELHGDLLARVGPAPDGQRLVPLTAYVAADDRRQLHIGPYGLGSRQAEDHTGRQDAQQQGTSHHFLPFEDAKRMLRYAGYVSTACESARRFVKNSQNPYRQARFRVLFSENLLAIRVGIPDNRPVRLLLG